MATKSSILGSKTGPSIISSQAGQVTVVRGLYDLLAADTIDTALQLRIVKLPADHRIIDLVLDNGDLDSSTAGAIDIGIEDDIQDPNDSTALLLFATAIDVQTAANRQNVMSHAAAILTSRPYDRYVVTTWETVSGTAKAGYLALTLTSVPELGAQFDGNA